MERQVPQELSMNLDIETKSKVKIEVDQGNWTTNSYSHITKENAIRRLEAETDVQHFQELLQRFGRLIKRDLSWERVCSWTVRLLRCYCFGCAQLLVMSKSFKPHALQKFVDEFPFDVDARQYYFHKTESELLHNWCLAIGVVVPPICCEARDWE